MLVSSTDAKPFATTSAVAGALYVPTDVIVKEIAPLTSLSTKKFRDLVESFDEGNLGGLTEEQWIRFCEANEKYFASLGHEQMGFDRFLGDNVFSVGEQPSHPRCFAKSVVRFLEGFAAGGIAGAISKTLIAPADRVKIIFQVDSKRSFSLLNAYRLGVDTVRGHGILGLWIGNGAMMMRVVPYAAITFASFDSYHSMFYHILKLDRDGTKDRNLEVVAHFLAGSFAGATAVACTYPLDLIRARLALHSCTGEQLPSYLIAYKKLVGAYGWRSMYSGLIPTIVGIIPYSGCSFAVFETSKSLIIQWRALSSENEIVAHERMMAGAFAGLVAQSVTYPLDIVRRRMQVFPNRYRGVFNALREIYKEEGIRKGLYKGLQMNWIKGPISVATGFTINDIIKRRMREYEKEAAQSLYRENLVTVPEAFVCGGVAAGVAKFWTAPFDRLKIIYQVGRNLSDPHAFGRDRFAIMSNMIVETPNMWQSSGITMIRVIPYGALTYCFFDIFQTAAERLLYSVTPTFATNFIAGGSAAALATVIVYPLDLLRTRVATNMLPLHSESYYWLLRDMAWRRGVRSLWEGCFFAVMGICPLAGIGFATYELIKERYCCETFGQRIIAGMFAGVTGQIATYPFNIAKRRRQAEKVVYSRVGDIKNIFVNPGVYAFLYRRMPFGWSIGAMTFGISFAVNDMCRDGVIRARKEILHDFFF